MRIWFSTAKIQNFFNISRCFVIIFRLKRIIVYVIIKEKNDMMYGVLHTEAHVFVWCAGA